MFLPSLNLKIVLNIKRDIRYRSALQITATEKENIVTFHKMVLCGLTEMDMFVFLNKYIL